MIAKMRERVNYENIWKASTLDRKAGAKALSGACLTGMRQRGANVAGAEEAGEKESSRRD